MEATQFNQRYRRYEEIENVPDRLRWCRHSRGLAQAEVALATGMSKNVYKNIEDGFVQSVSKEIANKLAAFYGIPPADLMDDYSQFLLDGQANRIIAYRESLGMKRKPFARFAGVPIRSLQEWEKETKTISRKSWEQYFEGRA